MEVAKVSAVSWLFPCFVVILVVCVVWKTGLKDMKKVGTKHFGPTSSWQWTTSQPTLPLRLTLNDLLTT